MSNAVKQRDFMRFTSEVYARMLGDYVYECVMHAHGESKKATLNPTRCTRSNCLVEFLNKRDDDSYYGHSE